MITIKENENKHFSFKLDVKGTDLKQTSARLIFEGLEDVRLFNILINEDGTCEHKVAHKDLLALKGIYYKLYQLQFKDQENVVES